MNVYARNAVVAGAVAMLAACASNSPLEAPASPPPATGVCSPDLLEGLKGLTLEAARARLERAGVRYRVVSDGAKEFPLTMDYDHNRVGLELERGVVVAARCG